MKRIIACLCLSALLSACAMQSAMTPAVFDGPSIEQMQAIPLNVAKVEFHDEYTPPATSMEGQFDMPPSVAVKKLVEDKLKAEGYDNILRVIVEDASVTMQDLPVATDFMGTFTREPSERYNARVALRFELVNEQAPDIILGHAAVVGKRTKTLLENTSLADRDRAYAQLTKELMLDVYDGFDTVVRGTFGKN